MPSRGMLVPQLGDNMQIGAVVFSNEYGLLGKTEQADELLLKITADVSSEK